MLYRGDALATQWPWLFARTLVVWLLKREKLMTEPPGHRAPAVGSRPPRGRLGWAVQDRLWQMHFQHHVAGGFRLYPQVAAAVADKPLQDPQVHPRPVGH